MSTSVNSITDTTSIPNNGISFSTSHTKQPSPSHDYLTRRYLAWKESMQMKAEFGRVKWKVIFDKYQIDENSLSRYVRNGIEPSTRAQQNKSRSKLNSNDDKILTKWIVDQNLYGRYPSFNEIYIIANHLYRQKFLNNNLPVNNLNRKSWIQSWLRRSKLVTESLGTIHKLLLDGYCYENCKSYFDQLKSVVGQIDNDLIYNVEQTGFNIGDTSTLRGRQMEIPIPKYRLQSQNQGWLTVIETIRSNGNSIKPFIVIKTNDSNSINKTIHTNEYSLTYSESGWTNKLTFLQFLKYHFDPITKHHASKNGILHHRLLIFDGKNNNCNDEFIQYCIENKIIVIQLPPMTSWCLQPLDVGIFSQNKQNILKAEDDWFNINQQVLQKSQFINLILENRLKILSTENINASFRLTGIYPFDNEFLERIPRKGKIEKALQETLTRMVNEWLIRVMEYRPDEEELMKQVTSKRFSVATRNLSYGRLTNYMNNNKSEELGGQEGNENEEYDIENDNIIESQQQPSILNKVKNYNRLNSEKLNQLSTNIAETSNNIIRMISESAIFEDRNKILDDRLNQEISVRITLEKDIQQLQGEISRLKERNS